MSVPSSLPLVRRLAQVLRQLLRDHKGNAMAIMAASLFPLLALVGGGVDMGRGYLAQSRLQQACDAGVLAARHRLGSSVAVDGVVPSNVAATGQRFFNVNFRDGAYGTENRQFEMTLESNYAISGQASVDVPTTIMQVFGYSTMPVEVSCESILNFSDLDVMMVVDVTGSMRWANPGDTLSRLDSVKQVIRNFHAQIESAKAPGTEIRYGFVPYATNVNVGGLLQDDWMVDSWAYQSREDTGVRIPNTNVARTYQRNVVHVSGTISTWATISSYTATWNPPPTADQSGWYSCDRALPTGTGTTTTTATGPMYVETQASPAAVLQVTPYQSRQNGTTYRHSLSGSTCRVQQANASNYVTRYELVREIPSFDRILWRYAPITREVSNWRSETTGCIEERDTYEIDDYDNVDFSRALDLDIDLVPTPGNLATQWRPRYPSAIRVRRILMNGSGDFNPAEYRTTDEYADTGTWWFSDCPAPAQRLQEMDASQLDTYLATLRPYGATYHDIGMIWGGRLLSPTGIFAAENADTEGHTRSRNMIWLTDGQTEPYDLAYGVYGVDGLDQRRWDPDSSSLTLTQTIEHRFAVACEQVKNRNITVWVVAFGTSLNPIMTECAGPGHYFEARNSAELSAAFATIARSMSELRINN
ncbi:MAG: VWA domain-containing protein [Erythrobacter sp.]|nr:VWA domain-containing protein [Erythrobacter sp.]